MSTEQNYTLHEYDHRFDAGLARMWNESDDQWPGTFTDGVPMTEERIRDWMDRVEAIVRFIVAKNNHENGSTENASKVSDDKVIGYGDLWNTATRPGSAYVALLNVHPEHQGKSLARRMLVRMVDWAVENGYDRVTIGTWPANLKAMPLYKKVGFFWEPGTSVYMENYLPAVRLHPLAQEYFNKHDWYKTYRRDLKQVEDDMRHPCTGDTKVYILRWEEDGDQIEAVFDRNAQSLTGFATSGFTETPAWAAYARVGESEPAQGVSYPMEWEVINKSDAPLTVKLFAKGDEGIAITHRKSYSLQPGERKMTTATFRVAPDAPKYRSDHHDLPTPKITTKLEIGGQKLEFGTGLRYRPAIEFSLHPEVVTLLPGVSQTVHLQLRSRAKRSLAGMVKLNLPIGVTASWQTSEFETPSEGYAGIPLTLTAEKGGFYPLEMCVEFDDAGTTVTTQPKRLSVVAIAPGGYAAGEGDEELILENDYFRITAKAKSGEAKIWNKDLKREEALLMEEVGPAFVPLDLHEQEYDLHLHQSDRAAKAIMTVRSTRFPGIVVGREIAINASPLIHVRSWVSNNREETREGLQQRLFIRTEHESDSMITIPLQERLVHEHRSQFSIAENDIPKKLDRYAEEWLAYESLGNVVGFVWPAKGLKELDAEWGRHFFYIDLPALAPFETRHVAPLYLYAGPGDWQTVQRTWRRLRGTTHEHLPQAPADETKSYLDITFNKPLMTLNNQIAADLRITTTREYKLDGEITIQPPLGWDTDPDRMPISSLDRTNPAVTSIILKGEYPKVGAYAGEIRLETQLFDRVQPFTILRLGNASQAIETEQSEREGHPLWTLHNGRNQWTVAPDFHGGIISWQETGNQTNHLLTSFPEEGELSWMKPFFGGLRPILHEPGEGGWPGKLHKEKFDVAPVTVPDAQNLSWQGLRLTSELTREAFRGLCAELDYLTLPGSNLLRTTFRLVNQTSIYRKAEPGFLTFVQVDGTHKNGAAHTPAFHRKRTPHMTWAVTSPWVAIENPDTGHAMIAVHATGWQQLLAMDWGTHGVHFNVFETVNVPPKGVYELTVYLALAESVNEAKRYEVLKNL